MSPRYDTHRQSIILTLQGESTVSIEYLTICHPVTRFTALDCIGQHRTASDKYSSTASDCIGHPIKCWSTASDLGYSSTASHCIDVINREVCYNIYYPRKFKKICPMQSDAVNRVTLCHPITFEYQLCIDFVRQLL